MDFISKNADAKVILGKIMEMVNGGREVRPLDIRITKTVCVLFIDAILLLICVSGSGTVVQTS
jgi:F-type H+-transporting ATPase subunit a